MLPEDDDTRHDHEAEGVRNTVLLGDACGNDRPVSESTMETGGATTLRRRNENHNENKRSDSDALRENGATKVRFWMTGLTNEEYDSEERKRPK